MAARIRRPRRASPAPSSPSAGGTPACSIVRVVPVRRPRPRRRAARRRDPHRRSSPLARPASSRRPAAARSGFPRVALAPGALHSTLPVLLEALARRSAAATMTYFAGAADNRRARRGGARRWSGGMPAGRAAAPPPRGCAGRCAIPVARSSSCRTLVVMTVGVVAALVAGDSLERLFIADAARSGPMWTSRSAAPTTRCSRRASHAASVSRPGRQLFAGRPGSCCRRCSSVRAAASDDARVLGVGAGGTGVPAVGCSER